MSQGKAGTIEIQTGPKPGISKAKSGNLLVVRLMNKMFIPSK